MEDLRVRSFRGTAAKPGVSALEMTRVTGLRLSDSTALPGTEVYLTLAETELSRLELERNDLSAAAVPVRKLD
ncbi:hypothetical protein D3C81_2095460 [compost metagenome]